MSAAIGAALAGGRTITATSSQGLALMAEVVYIAASLRAPVVMALGNRALSGPINIHCDHSDSMLIRDSGAIQLFVENAQEAYDAMLLAPRLAEQVRLPVLVCQDGFTITHAAEPVELLDDLEARAFVGPYRLDDPLLDVRNPASHGPFAMPDYYFELRQQQVAAMEEAAEAIDVLAAELESLTGRRYRSLRAEVDGARIAVVALGSTAGTIRDALANVADVGLVELHAYRPFPAAALRTVLADVDEAVVLDRADAPGGVPPLFGEVAAALYGSGVALRSHVYGLGGRELHPADIRALVAGGAGRYVGLRGAACPA